MKITADSVRTFLAARGGTATFRELAQRWKRYVKTADLNTLVQQMADAGTVAVEPLGRGSYRISLADREDMRTRDLSARSRPACTPTPPPSSSPHDDASSLVAVASVRPTWGQGGRLVRGTATPARELEPPPLDGHRPVRRDDILPRPGPIGFRTSDSPHRDLVIDRLHPHTPVIRRADGQCLRTADGATLISWRYGRTITADDAILYPQVGSFVGRTWDEWASSEVP